MTKNQKKSLPWSVVFSYSMQQQWTISWLDCDVWWKVDFIWQPASTGSEVGQRSSKALPKAKPAPKKVIATVRWPAAHRSHHSFLNPGKPLRLRSTLNKSMRCPKNCNAYSWHCQQKGPNSSAQQCPTSHHTTNTSEVEWIGLWSFASSAIFPWPLTNWLPLPQASQQLFIGRMLP